MAIQSPTKKTFGFAVEILGSNGSGKTFGLYSVSTSGQVSTWVKDTRKGDEYQGFGRAVFETEAEAREVALELSWSGQRFSIRRAKMV